MKDIRERLKLNRRRDKLCFTPIKQSEILRQKDYIWIDSDYIQREQNLGFVLSVFFFRRIAIPSYICNFNKLDPGSTLKIFIKTHQRRIFYDRF